VRETNKYVASRREGARPAGYRTRWKWPPVWMQQWKDIDLDELDLWIGVCILMGVSHRGSERSFWETRWTIRRPVASQIMSRDRFKAIKRRLHAESDDEHSPRPEDPDKIGVLLNMFLETAASIYIPGKPLTPET